MKNFETVNDVLDFAISQEEGASEFYMGLAERADRPGMREVFVGFAHEELGHKKKLQGVKEGLIPPAAAEKITDLKIADYLPDLTPTPDMDYQETLILAMKKEKAAFRLYTDMANSVEDESLKATFVSLAQEEAKHKLRFELEYDEHFLAEN